MLDVIKLHRNTHRQILLTLQYILPNLKSWGSRRDENMGGITEYDLKPLWIFLELIYMFLEAHALPDAGSLVMTDPVV